MYWTRKLRQEICQEFVFLESTIHDQRAIHFLRCACDIDLVFTSTRTQSLVLRDKKLLYDSNVSTEILLLSQNTTLCTQFTPGKRWFESLLLPFAFLVAWLLSAHSSSWCRTKRSRRGHGGWFNHAFQLYWIRRRRVWFLSTILAPTFLAGFFSAAAAAAAAAAVDGIGTTTNFTTVDSCMVLIKQLLGHFVNDARCFKDINRTRYLYGSTSFGYGPRKPFKTNPTIHWFTIRCARQTKLFNQFQRTCNTRTQERNNAVLESMQWSQQSMTTLSLTTYVCNVIQTTCFGFDFGGGRIIFCQTGCCFIQRHITSRAGVRDKHGDELMGQHRQWFWFATTHRRHRRWVKYSFFVRVCFDFQQCLSHFFKTRPATTKRRRRT